MTAKAITSSAVWTDARLAAIIMVGACVNALLVRVVEQVGIDGQASLSFGISPFQLVTIFVAAHLSLGRGEATRSASPLLDALVLGLILIPSSAVSWLALALYAGATAWRTTDERRMGALLFLGLALTALWSSVLLKWIAAPVTGAEAYVVGLIVSALRPDIVQAANVIGNPDTHSLILMTRCTTADALPIAIVSLVAVASLLGGLKREKFWRACAALALFVFVANLARLCAMAWSADLYAFVHGPIGANVFDGALVLAVLGLGNWASQP